MRRFERSSSSGTIRSSPSQSVAALRSASLCAAISYARFGVEPPDSATWPPAQAMSTSRSATSAAGSATTRMSVAVIWAGY